jgi:hypothetical protein
MYLQFRSVYGWISSRADQLSVYLQILASITGSQKISMPTTIVVSGIAKMFVGELIETGKFRVVLIFNLSLSNSTCCDIDL